MNSVISGEDFYDANGQFTGYSVDSVTGNGQDFYFQNGKTGHSVDSIIGNGQNYYGDDGSRGFSVDSPFGGGSDIFNHEDDNN